MLKTKINYDSNFQKYGGYSNSIANLVAPNSHVLDIGCSTGKLAQVLKNKNCKVFGVDIDRESLKKANEYCYKTLPCDLDDTEELKKIIKNETFDAITMGDIIEHIKYPGVLLANLKPFLSNKGKIIASIPNSAFILCRMKFLFGNFNYNKKGGLMDEDHLRFFSFKTAKNLFQDSGYQIQRFFGTCSVKNRFLFLRPLAKIYPKLFALHIIIAAKN